MIPSEALLDNSNMYLISFGLSFLVSKIFIIFSESDLDMNFSSIFGSSLTFSKNSVIVRSVSIFSIVSFALSLRTVFKMALSVFFFWLFLS